MKNKTCIQCGENFPLTEEYFNKRKTSKDGFYNDCKECKRGYSKKYNATHSEDISENKKNYYQTNTDEIKRKNNQRYQANKEDVLNQKRQYYAEKKEEILKKRKVYVSENKNTISQKRKEYYKKNKEYFQASNQRYRIEHKDDWTIRAHKRSATKRLLPNSLTKEQWGEIKTAFGNACAYCGADSPLEQEHFIPLSKGGEYTTRNIIPACKTCNCSKQDRPFAHWYRQQPFYNEQKEKFIKGYIEVAGGTSAN